MKNNLLRRFYAISSKPSASKPSLRVAIILWILASVMGNVALAQGVGVVDAMNETYLHLASNRVDVTVEDQVAVVTSTQEFENTRGINTQLSFAFPLAEDASPIGIRWLINDIWYRGLIDAVPQDTTLPGG